MSGDHVPSLVLTTQADVEAMSAKIANPKSFNILKNFCLIFFDFLFFYHEVIMNGKLAFIQRAVKNPGGGVFSQFRPICGNFTWGQTIRLNSILLIKANQREVGLLCEAREWNFFPENKNMNSKNFFIITFWWGAHTVISGRKLCTEGGSCATRNPSILNAWLIATNWRYFFNSELISILNILYISVSSLFWLIFGQSELVTTRTPTWWKASGNKRNNLN